MRNSVRGKGHEEGGWAYTKAVQGIFRTQGWNPRLLQWQAGSLPLSHPEAQEAN